MYIYISFIMHSLVLRSFLVSMFMYMYVFQSMYVYEIEALA